jgi:hypothetical protein
VAPAAPARVAISPRSPIADVRLAVLQAAATFGSGQDWAPSVVLETADKWLAWLNQA